MMQNDHLIKSDTDASRFAILICTRNRKADLLLTLSRLANLLLEPNVDCTVLDDGSTDGTFDAVRSNYPGVVIKRNEVSKGYLFCRNKLLNESTADYAISLDDDAHFLTDNPLACIERTFNQNPSCGLLAFRIFWGTAPPASIETREEQRRVKSFVGCGHVWRMTAWRSIPDYPEWYVFYGEEDFASFELYKANWQIIYTPEILVHHRVDLIVRRKAGDHAARSRRSLASGWFNFLLFVPAHKVPRKIAASIYWQFRTRILKGDLKALKPLTMALFDVVSAIPKIRENANRFSEKEFDLYYALEETPLYWKPENERG